MDLQGFTRLWKWICEDSQDFGNGLMGIHKDLQGFTRIHETLEMDSQVFFWTKICFLTKLIFPKKLE